MAFSFIPSSNPRQTDPRWAILQKILLAITGGGGGGGGAIYQENFQGTGDVPAIFPDRLDKPASWTSTDTGTRFEWVVDDQIWF